MTIIQLIKKLQEFPEDMPVTTWNMIDPRSLDDPDSIEITVKRYEAEYKGGPYFDYVNLT